MKRSTIALALMLGVACVFATPAPGATPPRDTSASSARPAGKAGPGWPQWRGPGRDAVSPETGLVHSWGESGPQILWRIPAGAGFSSVSVAGGRLYTLWDQDGKQFLVSLDATDGHEIWRRHLGGSFSHYYGDGPRSTPLIDAGLVFAVGTDGLLLAADRATGEPKWQHDLVKEFDAALPSYGFASSPLAIDDRVIVEAGAEGAAFIAFDRRTGEVAWKSGGDRPAYSSPIAIAIGGATQIVFWSAHGLHAVSADDGTALWDYPWETFCPVTGDPLNTATPIFMPPDRIFLSSGSGAAAIRITKAGAAPKPAVAAAARDSSRPNAPGSPAAFTVETLWKSDLMRSDVNTSLLLGDTIYGFDRGTLKSLDARTGEEHWKARGFQRGSLIAADGALIVLGEAGNLALIDATPDAYVERATAQVLSGKNWTSPSLADGRLYLRNQEELVCINLKG